MNHLTTAKGTELPLIDLKGKKYLQVQWRLVWFREEKPTWGIETTLNNGEGYCIARAEVKDEAGRIIATSHKREDKAHFADYAEKAETGAIGRALALCGYGTQFAPDIDEEHRIVDSPAELPKASSASLKDAAPVSQYLIKFGKFKGKRLCDVDAKDINSYCTFIANKAAEKGEKLKGDVAELLDNAAAYLDSLEAPKPKADFLTDEIPF